MFLEFLLALIVGIACGAYLKRTGAKDKILRLGKAFSRQFSIEWAAAKAEIARLRDKFLGAVGMRMS